MNTALSGSGRVDDIKSHPQGEIRGATKLVKITEHSREGSDWVDDIRGHPRGRVGRSWRTRQEDALQVGLKEKAKEFAEKGSELYIP